MYVGLPSPTKRLVDQAVDSIRFADGAISRGAIVLGYRDEPNAIAFWLSQATGCNSTGLESHRTGDAQ
ncbi:hypothetical protein RE6C_02315 [Rhodopirellula europaea 6C]|uniref:Uncharacterized protein n=1 Tax=Rhodopirellula europaea 6C TaxID=1263867 RepID=M2AW41_9BACT|nr:hypothetical protein RE6C_02315 [Rhodopirellula europaea 6C]